MSGRMQQWNPSFMNPMLEKAGELIKRIDKIFRDGSDRTQALNQEEAADLKSRYPESSIRDLSLDDIVVASSQRIQRLSERCIPTYSNITKIIEGKETRFKREFLKELYQEGSNLAAEWASTSLGINDPEILAKLRLCDCVDSLSTRIETTLHRDLSTDEYLQLRRQFFGPLYAAPTTEENSQSTYFTADDKLDMARAGLGGLFIVACEFVIPGYGAALIEARAPELADDIKRFFKQYGRQLGQLREDYMMSAEIFNKLTEGS